MNGCPLLDVNEAENLEELKSILAEDERSRNAVLGKTVEPLEAGEGKIIVLVILQ